MFNMHTGLRAWQPQWKENEKSCDCRSISNRWFRALKAGVRLRILKIMWFKKKILISVFTETWRVPLDSYSKRKAQPLCSQDLGSRRSWLCCGQWQTKLGACSAIPYIPSHQMAVNPNFKGVSVKQSVHLLLAFHMNSIYTRTLDVPYVDHIGLYSVSHCLSIKSTARRCFLVTSSTADWLHWLTIETYCQVENSDLCCNTEPSVKIWHPKLKVAHPPFNSRQSWIISHWKFILSYLKRFSSSLNGWFWTFAEWNSSEPGGGTLANDLNCRLKYTYLLDVWP